MSEENNAMPPRTGNPLADNKAEESHKKEDSVAQLKSVTQNLKSITSPIAPQANLRNTGIMSGNQLTEKQREAAKARTSRISLSSAIGVAEVKDEAAPMKTIKIQRPKLVPRQSLSKSAVAKPSAAAQTPPSESAESSSEEPSTTVTQRKTLKIARPSAGVARGKLAIKKPSAQPAKPEPAADEIPELEPVDDLSAVSNAPAPAPTKAPDQVASVSKPAAIVGLIAQLAACAVAGILAYYLYQDYMLPLYCGGCTP